MTPPSRENCPHHRTGTVGFSDVERCPTLSDVSDVGGVWAGGAGTGSAPPEVLEALLESIADAVYMVDHGGHVRFVNPAALAMLGYDDERELLGKDSHAVIHSHRPDGGSFPEEDCPLLLPRATGKTVRVEDDWFVRRDGTIVPVAYSSAPVRAAGGRGAVVVFHDITGRRAAERSRRREAAERARAEELQASRARIVAAADAERRRLGRDIHDGAQQRLMNVALGIQAGLADLTRDPVESARHLRDALEAVRAAIADLRALAAGIHPAILTNRGLRAAIESLTGTMPLPTRFHVPPTRWAPDVEAAAYFVVAEALANVAKHSQATGADVEVVEDGALIRIVVRDDGRGGAVRAPGHGLQGLVDRVSAAGGRLTIESAVGRGTELVAELPLPS